VVAGLGAGSVGCAGLSVPVGTAVSGSLTVRVVIARGSTVGDGVDVNTVVEPGGVELMDKVIGGEGGAGAGSVVFAMGGGVTSVNVQFLTISTAGSPLPRMIGVIETKHDSSIGP